MKELTITMSKGSSILSWTHNDSFSPYPLGRLFIVKSQETQNKHVNHMDYTRIPTPCDCKMELCVAWESFKLWILQRHEYLLQLGH